MKHQVLLVSAAEYKGLGEILPGRSDVPLTVTGRAHAHIVSSSLSATRILSVGHGPAPRARVTAQIIAYPHDLKPYLIPDLDDLDVGHWQGRDFNSLKQDPEWIQWQQHADSSRIPGGESIADARSRVMGVLNNLPHQDGITVLATHSNIIRAVIASILECPFSSAMRLDIGPASLTYLHWKDSHWQVLGINLRNGHGLVGATNHGRWPENRDAIGEHWAPGSETRLGV